MELDAGNRVQFQVWCGGFSLETDERVWWEEALRKEILIPRFNMSLLLTLTRQEEECASTKWLHGLHGLREAGPRFRVLPSGTQPAITGVQLSKRMNS